MAVPRKRPFGVAIRAAVVIAIGAALTFLATLLVLAALALVALNMEGARAYLVLAIVALVLSIVILVAGIGLWRMRPWAWWLAVTALSLQIVSYAARVGIRWSPVLWDNLVWLVPVFSLVYLIAVRRHFR